MTIDARIEYVTTDDGVSLACTKFGEGPPVIMHYSGMISNFEMELAFPPTLLAYEELAKVATVIRYDFRNTGLSTRGVADVSMAAHMCDLDVVFRHFQLESAALLFPYATSLLGVEYAAAHPERVSALVMPFPRLDGGFPLFPSSVGDLLQAAARLGWEVLASVFAVVGMGLEAHAYAAWFARYILESADMEDAIRMEAMIAQHDANPAAAMLRCPTLLLYRRLPPYNIGQPSPEMVREHRANTTRLSAAIPGAQSAIFDGSGIWYMDDELMMARIVEFLEDVRMKAEADAGQLSFVAQQDAAPGNAFLGHLVQDLVRDAEKSREAITFRTVLFTDLVGHTEMMSRLGDVRGRAVLREHEGITREVLKGNGGTEVKTMGDGFMASFGSVTRAVECAVALQRAFAAREGEPLSIRVGLNAGEPIEEDGDLFGATVILASRIAAKVEAGEILVADTVRGLCSGKGFLFADRGEFVAKGFDEAVRIYEVSWRDLTL